MSPTIRYASFLVRLWREESGTPSGESIDWQSEVEHVQTGERWSFGTLDELLAFLRRRAEDPDRVRSMTGNESQSEEVS